MNKVFLIGNLTRDPEKRSTSDGTPVCSFTIAVNRRGKNAQAGQPEADFFRITAWRGLAENCVNYLRKGRKAAVTGSIRLNTYQGQDGQTHATLDVTADDVEFLTPRDQQPTEQAPAYNPPQRDAQTGFAQAGDDELPF